MSDYDIPVLISRGVRTKTYTDENGNQVTETKLLIERRWCAPIWTWTTTDDVEESEE